MTGRFPQVSGMTVHYDPKAPVGARVGEVRIGGKPLDPAARYKLATIDYVARGGDGYAMLAKAPQLITAEAGRQLTTIVKEYIERASQAPGSTGVAPAAGGRLVPKA